MAYVSNKGVDPRDLRKNTAIGVQLPFNAPGVFYSVFSTKEQIKYNVINLLLTSKGERVENPNFGTLLRNQLFNQIDTANFQDIENSIVDSIDQYIPEIRVVKIEFLPNTDTNTINIKLFYQILISGETDTIIVNFE
jgi:phage baseplate assembly protein W